MVREAYFPESWGEATQLIHPDLTMVRADQIPEFGEPTELGMRFVVTPTVDPDKYTITLDVIPELQYFLGWTRYSDVVRMPIIKAWTTLTQTTLYDGESYPIGSFLEDVYDKSLRKRVRNRFITLLTARLVNPDGSHLRDFHGELNPVITKIKPVSTQVKSPEEQKLEKIILDRVELKDAGLQTAVITLKEIIKTKNKNLGFILCIDEEELARIPQINLNLKNIPCSDALRYLCMQTGLQYRMGDDDILMIGYESIQDMDTVFFSVRPALITRIAPYEVEYYEDNEEGDFFPDYIGNMEFEEFLESPFRSRVSEALEKYFEERLITFPDPSTIFYSRKNQVLTVKNTKKNLEVLENLLRNLDIEQPQVEIESTIVEISNKDLISLIGKKAALASNLTSEQIQKIIDSPKGRILSSQSTIAKNGEESNARLVNETYLPDTYSAHELVAVDGKIQFTPVLAEFSTANDVGGSLTVTPTVSPDNHTISLSLNPQFMEFSGWSDYSNFLNLEKENKRKTMTTSMKMGIRSRKDLNSCIKLYDGTTILAGRTQLLDYPNVKEKEVHLNMSHTEFLNKAKKDGNELKNVFFFIKADIINPDGRVVR